MSETGGEGAMSREYSYVDTSTGRVVSFTPKSDEAMVTFDGSATWDTLNDVVESTPLLSISKGYNLERGFAAVYIDPAATMDDAADALDAVPEVAGSIPVMLDEHGASRYF